MRILELSTFFARGGGIQIHILALSKWLRARGHEVSIGGCPGTLLNPNIDESFVSLDIDQVTQLEDFASEPKSRILRVVAAIRCALKLRRVLKARQIDLVHVHETAAAIVARIAVLGLSIPIVFTFHGATEGRLPEVARTSRFACNKVIALSQRAANDLSRLGVPQKKLRVVGLGIAPPPTIAEAEWQNLRHSYLSNDAKYLVVTVGRLAVQKGIDLLVDVAKRVTARRKDVHFVVVGDGPLRCELESMATEAGIQSRVTFVGYSDQPHAYLRAADVFLLPSRWEALPISIVEAFRAGLPVIACDTGGVTELVTSEVGVVVPVGDVDALTASVMQLVSDDQLRGRMSTAARARGAEDRFALDHMNPKIEALYNELLAS